MTPRECYTLGVFYVIMISTSNKRADLRSNQYSLLIAPLIVNDAQWGFFDIKHSIRYNLSSSKLCHTDFDVLLAHKKCELT